MKVKLKTVFKFSIPIILVFIVCDIVITLVGIDISKINDTDFVFTFTGVLLGFAITILPFIADLVDKIKIKAEEKFKDDNTKKERIETRIKSLFSEVKDDIVLVFISLIILSTLYISVKMELPEAKNFIQKFFLVETILKSIRLSIFILDIYAIYDLIVCAFRLSNGTTILVLEDK